MTPTATSAQTPSAANRYLLDVNALVALGFANHEFHQRVAVWLRALKFPPLATCSITELGFIRVLAQAAAYGFTIAQARTLLAQIKQAELPSFTFIQDSHHASQLPRWVKAPRQITDGHLVKLAAANSSVLATLDTGIPGAYLIPR
jgi:predicted nucleic acid-binding protein